MSLKLRNLLCTIAGAAVLLAWSLPATATEQGPIRKLGRGVCNTALGVCEVPLKVYDVNQTEGGVAAVTYGLFKGFAYFFAREGVGLAELLSFPVPLPGMTESPNEGGWGYAPMIVPEFIFDTEHNPYNIIYQDFPPS